MKLRLVAVLLLMAVGGTATAQETPGVEFSAGYAYLKDKDIDQDFPLGWYADIAGNLTPWFGLVGEVGGSYKTVTEAGDDFKLSVHSLMGGVRLAHRGGATLYVQVLAGAARATVSVLGQSESNTDFAVQPGIGVDLRLSDGMALRLGGDFRRIYGETDPALGGRPQSDEWRLIAGLTFH